MKTLPTPTLLSTLLAMALLANVNPHAQAQGKAKFDATDDEKPKPTLWIQLADAKGRPRTNVKVILRSHATGKSITATTNAKGYIRPYTAPKGTKVSIFPRDSGSKKFLKAAAATVVADRSKTVKLQQRAMPQSGDSRISVGLVGWLVRELPFGVGSATGTAKAAGDPTPVNPRLFRRKRTTK